MKILIVDDEHVIRHGCRLILEEKGHTVETSATCKEGIEAVTNNSYDLVLLDLKLPDQSGTEMFKVVRSNNQPRIIVMSGYINFKNMMSSGEQEKFDFLPKPFTDEELITAVKKNGIVD
jgi:YesN/AraC family two-component response regulator